MCVTNMQYLREGVIQKIIKQNMHIFLGAQHVLFNYWFLEDKAFYVIAIVFCILCYKVFSLLIEPKTYTNGKRIGKCLYCMVYNPQNSRMQRLGILNDIHTQQTR